MTLSIWRYAHLALAIISSFFLFILAATGVILSVDAVTEKYPNYQVENFDTINLAQALPALRKVYPEIIELRVDHNKFVRIDAQDIDGNSVKGYIDPLTGKLLGPEIIKSPFIQWTTALHRSLFLKETGRVMMGVASFILCLISISGVVLIAKRQQGIRNFFVKINRDFFAQYFHVVAGRLLLIPTLLLAVTGTYLVLMHVDVFDLESKELVIANDATEESIAIAEFKIFQETKLSDVEKIEFPFMEDDPEEFFRLTLKTRDLTVHQLTGAIVAEERLAKAVMLEKLTLDLHTGRSNILLAIILGFASLNILFFIYSGFVITWKRSRTKIRNKHKAQHAEVILLVGSENGSTLFFANCVHKQLLAHGISSYITQMNQFSAFPKAQKMLVFTSTFGLGTAPSNADKFHDLLAKHPANQPIEYAVVGFGSKSYADYCSFAFQVNSLFAAQSWATEFIPVHTVNDKSVDEFTQWIHQWSEKSLIPLSTAAASYQAKLPPLHTFKVLEKTATSADNTTFKIVLESTSKKKFQSGDLLAIYPANDFKERLYSIGANDGKIQLMVKLYTDGLGSSFLYKLQPNDCIKARILVNKDFHMPQAAAQVAMIANGTGIAPFLGMIASNKSQTAIRLFAGFRYNNSLIKEYGAFAASARQQGKLESLELAFSREENPQYVMDLIAANERYFIDLLSNQGVIMVCGSLLMLRDVEKALNRLTEQHLGRPLSYYSERQQLLTDCY
ncbi:PepSY domain-containing protein [Sphingobacteriaceae bacterium WQ 2009]|uniref:NADPH--hemoprotein reductase n=1 Tax=Rhinopithecimicrobium faecis TaxID=2820698 RepID=A0A8T4H7U0_9SPHI|nr:PepSY domain-containing protein [Sphingobacteriaceae bacterium WQ 2009]